MVYGVIDRENHKFYTYLDNVFPAIQNAQEHYNWLVTDYYCNMSNAITQEIDRQGYCWISGENLTRFALQDNTQWIGAVFSGFQKDIPLKNVLEYPLPVWEYGGFWRNPLTLQHPLAEIELVPWDSTYTLLLSTNEQIIANYRQAYPNIQDLTAYNDKR